VCRISREYGQPATLWLLAIEHKPHYFWATAVPTGVAIAFALTLV